MFSTETPQPLFSRVHLHLIILKFGDVGRMTQNQVSKCNEVCQVTLLQLYPLLAKKSRELRKGEWSSFNSSENSNEGLEIPPGSPPISITCWGFLICHELLCSQETKHLPLHLRNKFQNGYKYPKSRFVCLASTDS